MWLVEFRWVHVDRLWPSSALTRRCQCYQRGTGPVAPEAAYRKKHVLSAASRMLTVAHIFGRVAGDYRREITTYCGNWAGRSRRNGRELGSLKTCGEKFHDPSAIVLSTGRLRSKMDIAALISSDPNGSAP